MGADRQIEDFERQMIAFYVRLFKIAGFPKSIGEIYGLLFVSLVPLTMDEVSQKLEISLGSASQGLKILRSFKAVKIVYSPGERKDFYEAEFDFRLILQRFLNEVIRPEVENAFGEIEDIESVLKKTRKVDVSAQLERLKVIRKVAKRAKQALPVLSKALSL